MADFSLLILQHWLQLWVDLFLTIWPWFSNAYKPEVWIFLNTVYIQPWLRKGPAKLALSVYIILIRARVLQGHWNILPYSVLYCINRKSKQTVWEDSEFRMGGIGKHGHNGYCMKWADPKLGKLHRCDGSYRSYSVRVWYTIQLK